MGGGCGLRGKCSDKERRKGGGRKEVIITETFVSKKDTRVSKHLSL